MPTYWITERRLPDVDDPAGATADGSAGDEQRLDSEQPEGEGEREREELAIELYDSPESLSSV